MRFGIFVPQGWRLDLVGIEPAEQWPTMLRLAQAIDAGPWESLWVYDHFHTTPYPTEEATHEAWTLMAAFAAATSRVRLGQMCTCMGYRNPMYLAKVAATVDAISGGRTEMGIGGGWYEHEWRAYGYGFPGAGERLAMLDEGVEIMRQAWTTGTATLDGKHYQVDGAICRPLPLQEGGIPLWVAGGGERKTLRTAAKYANYTNFAGDPETFTHKSDVLAGHCRDLGTDFDAITRSANFDVFIAETEAEVAAELDRTEALYRSLIPGEYADTVMKRFRDSPLAGTPEQVVAHLERMAGLGLEYAIVNFHGLAHDSSGAELFERTVIPELTRR